jgi:hypothetical protein
VKDPYLERIEVSAAEILSAPPSQGETVILIPPDGRDFGRGRMLIRIGLGAASWVGSFASGLMKASSVRLMPGGGHLFVSAQGAGYIIDWKSRTLVEQIGTKVAAVTGDPTHTLCIVDHGGTRLEAFGPTGRLWKTGAISCGGFIRTGFGPHNKFLGEAWRASPPGWVRFSVDLATGEVLFGQVLLYGPSFEGWRKHRTDSSSAR